MAPSSTRSESPVRLLALGNELLADDAFGPIVAREVRGRLRSAGDIVATSEAGFHLLDYVLGVSRLVVVDTVQTGRSAPGTIHVFGEQDLRVPPGPSPHLTGIFEVLALARALGLDAAPQVTFIAVEAADCATIGGRMHPAIEGAVRVVTDRVIDLLEPELARATYA